MSSTPADAAAVSVPASTPHSPPDSDRHVRSLAGRLFLFALILRLGWATLATVTPVSDCRGYHTMAVRWLKTGEYRHSHGRAYRTPAYPAFLAGVYGVFGENHRAAWLLHAALGAACTALVVLIAARAASPRTALIAGLLHAVWPTSVIYVPVLVSENLATPLLLLCVYLCARANSRAGGSAVLGFLAAGLVFGLLMLVRPSNLFFAPGLLLVTLHDFARRVWRWQAPVMLIVGTAAALSPWLIRNYRLGLGPLTFSTQAGIAFRWGNHPSTQDGGSGAVDSSESAGLDEVAASRFHFNKALDWVRANPRRYAELCGVRLLRFFGKTVDDFANRYWWPTPDIDAAMLQWDRHEQGRPAQVRYAQTVIDRNWRTEERFRRALAPLILLAFVWALVRYRRFGLVTLPVCSYAVGLCLTAFVERYRVVSDPLLLICVGALLADIVFGASELGGGRNSRYVKGALAVAVIIAGVYVDKARIDRGWYRLAPLPQVTSMPGSAPTSAPQTSL